MEWLEIGLRVLTRADLSEAYPRIFAAFAIDEPLAPAAVRAAPRYLDPTSQLAQEEWRRAASLRGRIDLIQRRPLHIDVQVAFAAGKARPFHSLEWALFARSGTVPDVYRRSEALLRRLIEVADPHYAAAYLESDIARQHSDPSRGLRRAGLELERTALPGLYWLNYLGPELASFVDRAQVAAANPSTEVLGGGLFFRLARTPEDLLGETARHRLRKIRAALGEELFFDLARPEREGRRPRFADAPEPPVEPARIRARIRDPSAFARTARTRAAAWRMRQGVAGRDREATQVALESAMRATDPERMSFEEFEEFVAVFGELCFPEGSTWVPSAFGVLVVPDDGRPPRDPVDPVHFFFQGPPRRRSEPGRDLVEVKVRVGANTEPPSVHPMAPFEEVTDETRLTEDLERTEDIDRSAPSSADASEDLTEALPHPPLSPPLQPKN
jgi:hypothetical protein